jgi:predicted ArsR family transcriptional regulator
VTGANPTRASYGVTAVLLVRLEARIGQWVAVDDLAEHFQLHERHVLINLEELAASGDVEVERADGEILRTRIAARGAEAGA